MTEQSIIEEIYTTLVKLGVVDTKKEFYRDWLNRSEGYLRYLKHAGKQPSVDALAICSSKLKHYSTLLKQNHHALLAAEFVAYSNKLDAIIFLNSKTKWMNLMHATAEVAQ